MHTETKHTAIPPCVKAAVDARDGGTCIICGCSGSPCAHVVRRSLGGRGDTEQNIVTLCGKCHYAYDEGLFLDRIRSLGFETRADIKEFIYGYMRDHYPGWTPESVIYQKWEV